MQKHLQWTKYLSVKYWQADCPQWLQPSHSPRPIPGTTAPRRPPSHPASPPCSKGLWLNLNSRWLSLGIWGPGSSAGGRPRQGWARLGLPRGEGRPGRRLLSGWSGSQNLISPSGLITRSRNRLRNLLLEQLPAPGFPHSLHHFFSTPPSHSFPAKYICLKNAPLYLIVKTQIIYFLSRVDSI